MKKFIVIVVILVAFAAAVAFYLKSTTPTSSAGVRLPLTAAQRDLLAAVPAGAETFALIPTAAVVRHKLFANPITRPPLLEYAETHQLPRSWMMGGADLVVWRAGKETAYAIRVDPFRAAIVRLYLMFASGIDARVDAGTFLINAGAAEPLGPERLDALLAAANGLGPADVLIVAQPNARGTFPPIGRPAVTAVNIGTRDVTLTSVAPLSSASSAAVAGGATRPRFPRNALLTATFRERPRIIGDLDRLFIVRVSHLLDDGGAVVLYDVNPGTLLPRPDGLLIAKATPDNHETVRRIESAVTTFGDVRESNGQIFLSFDNESMQKFGSDTFVEGQWPTTDWALRLDVKRAIPIVRKLSGSTGLRIAAPRVYRSARDLDDWLEYLDNASWAEVSHSRSAQTEELRVRVSS